MIQERGRFQSDIDAGRTVQFRTSEFRVEMTSNGRIAGMMKRMDFNDEPATTTKPVAVSVHYYDKWDRTQLITYLKFADRNYPKEMGEIYLAYDETCRGN